jgi:CheY-like chemotaxis protein
MRAKRTKARITAPPTRMRKLQNEIFKLRADLLTRSKMTRRLGHDFNNVLQTIVGEMEEFAEGEPDRSQVLLQRIMASVASGMRLTHELLSTGFADGPIASHSPLAVATSRRRKDEPTSPAIGAPVLIVDDQAPLREFIGSILVKAGYKVTLASNGAEAVTAVRDESYHLVLMDIHMPGMSGLVATQKIRKLKGPRSQIPIVAVSGSVPLQHVQSLIAAGMNDYLRKPFKTSDLLKTVESWSSVPSNTVAAPSTTSSDETMERAAFDRVCSLMGRPWTLRGLAMLKAQIEELFEPKSKAVRGAGQLADQAHALVSLAALLGFSSLSERCSALEEGYRSGRSVRLLFKQATAAALLARIDAIEFLKT